MPLVMSAPQRGDIARAVLEATAFAIRANVEQLESVSGMEVERLRLGGGMSRSRLFCRILCDVLDRPVVVARSAETSAVGAAILASVALGRYGSISEAADVMTVAGCELHPDVWASAAYEDCYERWSALSEGMADISDA